MGEHINKSKLRFTRFAHINLWEYIQTYLKTQAHPLTGSYMYLTCEQLNRDYF